MRCLLGWLSLRRAKGPCLSPGLLGRSRGWGDLAVPQHPPRPGERQEGRLGAAWVNLGPGPFSENSLEGNRSCSSLSLYCQVSDKTVGLVY